jgi:excisionase family DNA binding protein
LKNELKRIAPHQPEVAPISGVPAFTSNNRIAEKHRDGAPKFGAKPARRILTPVQAAELFGCDDKTITRWARQGYIPAHPLGQGKKKYWRFFEDELIDWLLEQKNGAFAA